MKGRLGSHLSGYFLEPVQEGMSKSKLKGLLLCWKFMMYLGESGPGSKVPYIRRGAALLSFLAFPPVPFTISARLICLTAMPAQSRPYGSANFNGSCRVLVYDRQGIHHHSCQVSSRSFLRQAPVSPQLSGLLLRCDFLFTQHMLPNSFKRQLSFMKVFFNPFLGYQPGGLSSHTLYLWARIFFLS